LEILIALYPDKNPFLLAELIEECDMFDKVAGTDEVRKGLMSGNFRIRDHRRLAKRGNGIPVHPEEISSV
jgi:hypothetical protein